MLLTSHELTIFPCSSPEMLSGIYTTAALYHAADNAIPSFVKRISPQEYYSFDRVHDELPRVLLFTKSKEISPLFRSLSREFRGLVAFAMGDSDEQVFRNLFKVRSSPWLVFQGFHKGALKNFRYRGSIDFMSISKYIKLMLKRYAKAPASSRAPVKTIIPELTVSRARQLHKDSRWNVILFVSSRRLERKPHSLLKTLQKKYATDPFVFYWAGKASTSSAAIKAFALTETSYCWVIVRPKALKYVRLPTSILSRTDIVSLLDRLRDGQLNALKLASFPF